MALEDIKNIILPLCFNPEVETIKGKLYEEKLKNLILNLEKGL